MDGAEDLRERRTALENAPGPKPGCGEDMAEQPADPEVLLDNELRNAGAAGIVPLVEGAFFGGKQGKRFHGVPSSRAMSRK